MIKLFIILYFVASVLLALSYLVSEFRFPKDMSTIPTDDENFCKKERHFFERFWILFPISMFIVLFAVLIATIKMRLSEG